MSKRLDELNALIQKNICKDTLSELSDENLLPEYKKSQSTNKNISLLKKAIISEGVDKEKCDEIIKKYIMSLIPPGTKGVIRGNKFNKIVKSKLLSSKYAEKSDIYDICFEKKHRSIETNEIPDWYIENKITNKVIIGMNQLDLWGGGHQANRGSKYLLNDKLDYIIICVVCNDVVIKTQRSKVFKLFDSCFEKGTLCYPNQIINSLSKLDI
jgi:hypothetical protein